MAVACKLWLGKRLARCGATGRGGKNILSEFVENKNKIFFCAQNARIWRFLRAERTSCKHLPVDGLGLSVATRWRAHLRAFARRAVRGDNVKGGSSGVLRAGEFIQKRMGQRSAIRRACERGE